MQAELLSQYLQLAAAPDVNIERIVFMGMGEPLLNLQNVLKAIAVFTMPQQADGIGLGAGRISISTSGILKGIDQLAAAAVNVRLSLSLHAALQGTRDVIMSDFKHVSLAALRETLAAYQRQKRKPILIEYIMIADVNDDAEHLRALIAYLAGLDVKVNLIAYNHVRGKSYQPSTATRIHAFAMGLRAERVPVVQRYKKGDDIAAACGQLSTLSSDVRPALRTETAAVVS